MVEEGRSKKEEGGWWRWDGKKCGKEISGVNDAPLLLSSQKLFEQNEKQRQTGYLYDKVVKQVSSNKRLCRSASCLPETRKNVIVWVPYLNQEWGPRLDGESRLCGDDCIRIRLPKEFEEVYFTWRKTKNNPLNHNLFVSLKLTKKYHQRCDHQG